MEGFSINALKFAAEAARSQGARLGRSELHTGSWLDGRIRSIMRWIDGAGIPPNHPDLQDFNKAWNAADEWSRVQEKVEVAKEHPISASMVAHAFPDGWKVVSISEDDLEHEDNFIKTDAFFIGTEGNAIYAFKDGNGVTQAMISTYGNIGNEAVYVSAVESTTTAGAAHVKQWLDLLRAEGHIVGNEIEDYASSSTDPSAHDLGDHLMDEYGLPAQFANFGGTAGEYHDQIGKIMSDYDVDTYWPSRRSRDSADALVLLAQQNGQLKAIEEGLQNVEEECWNNFLTYVDDGMEHKYPVEEDYGKNKRAYRRDLKAYDEERDAIEAASGWRQFCNYLYKIIQDAIKLSAKAERDRRKAWKATMDRRMVDSVMGSMDEEASGHGWYRTSARGISQDEWDRMAREARET